jgi:hypothetical protein
MGNRDDLARKEADAWAAFGRMVDAVPRERRGEPLLDEGWSVKDLVWHVAYWWSDATRCLSEMAAGMYEDVAVDVEATDARVVEESRLMSWAEVEGGAETIRRRLMNAWASAPDDETASERFRSATLEHYERHLPELRDLAHRIDRAPGARPPGADEADGGSGLTAP